MYDSNITSGDGRYSLLSINEARKILRIRHKTLTEIINEGKIKVIDVNGRIKIPRKNLDIFIDTESKIINEKSRVENYRKVPQSVKLILNSIINKHQ